MLPLFFTSVSYLRTLVVLARWASKDGNKVALRTRYWPDRNISYDLHYFLRYFFNQALTVNRLITLKNCFQNKIEILVSFDFYGRPHRILVACGHRASAKFSFSYMPLGRRPWSPIPALNYSKIESKFLLKVF